MASAAVQTGVLGEALSLLTDHRYGPGRSITFWFEPSIFPIHFPAIQRLTGSARFSRCLVSGIVLAKAWSRDSAISGSACLKQFEKDAVRRFSSQKNLFNDITISMTTLLQSASISLQRGLEVLSVINEKDSSFDIVYLAQFAEEDIGERCYDRGKQPNVKQTAGFGICAAYSQNCRLLIPITASSSAI